MDNPGSPSMLKPALIGGGAFGVAAGLPFVGALNCACCALIIGSGFLAAYVFSQACKTQGITFGPAQGALLGALSGVVYAVASSVVSATVSLVRGMDFGQVLEQIDSMGTEVPPQVREGLEWAAAAGPGLLLVIGFAISLVFGLIFATLGGLIGGAAFKVEPPAPAPPVEPPLPPVG